MKMHGCPRNLGTWVISLALLWGCSDLSVEIKKSPEPERREETLPVMVSIDALGVPSNYDQRIDYHSFSIGYDYDRKHAVWVGSALLPELVTLGLPRKNTFHEETLIPEAYRATLLDYKGSGYDRGHLAPNATHDHTSEAMYDTFTMANMSPQLPSFNRGDWASLEQYIRDCATSFDNGEPLFVFTGPIFGESSLMIGDSNIPVPEGYFKILYEFNDGTPSAMAIVAPQEVFDFDKLEEFIVPIDTIELLTGLDFAANLPDDLEDQLESQSSWVCAP